MRFELSRFSSKEDQDRGRVNPWQHKMPLNRVSQKSLSHNQDNLSSLTYRVVVIEGVEAVRELLEQDLQGLGYEVIASQDFNSMPLRMADHPVSPEKNLRFDFLLADVGDRSSRNLEYTTALVQEGCEVSRIALMAASCTNGQLAKVERLGCRVFIKPFSLLEVRDWLEEGRARISTDRTLALCPFR